MVDSLLGWECGPKRRGAEGEGPDVLHEEFAAGEVGAVVADVDVLVGHDEELPTVAEDVAEPVVDAHIVAAVVVLDEVRQHQVRREEDVDLETDELRVAIVAIGVAGVQSAILGTHELSVNSLHAQGVDDIGDEAGRI